MKRAVALLMLTAIFLTAFYSALSVSAAELTQENSFEELFPSEEGWLPISKPSDWATIKSGGKYYLTDNIVFENKQYMPTVEQSVDLVIDGNNRTVTLSGTQKALFAKTTRLTLKNIIIDGNLVYNDNAGMNSPIVQWDNLEATVLTNVISRVNYTVTNRAATYTSVSGVIPKAPKGSVFQKVMYTGNIVLELGARFFAAAGIVYNATGASFIDCVNNGNITLRGGITIAGPDRSYFALGGICARTDNSSSFLRCVNNGNITSDARVSQYVDTIKGTVAMGGIIGYSSGDQLVDCKNSGNIFQKTVVGDSSAGYMGGLVGYAQNILKISGSTNSGNLLCEENDFSVGGFIGTASKTKINNCSNTGEITVKNSNCFVGGIEGYSFNGSADLVDCSNSGKIVLDKGATKIFAGGILGLAKLENAIYESIWVENCSNSGEIIADISGENICLGGIVGSAQGLPGIYVQKNQNSGNITNTIQKGSSATGGIIGTVANMQSKTLSGAALDYEVDFCINTGTLYGNDRVGGILGAISGFMMSEAEFEINSCSNRGELKGVENVGGILGIFNEGNYDAESKTYSEAGISISSCENVGRILGEKVAGGILGRVADTEAKPPIKILSSASVGSVGEQGEGAATKYSGGIVGLSKAPVTVENCLFYGKLMGENIHAIGNENINLKDSYYAFGEQLELPEDAEGDPAVILAGLRAQLDVPVYDRSALEALVDSAKKVVLGNYISEGWIEFEDAFENAQKLLKKSDTELTQAEVTRAATHLSDAMENLKPLEKQTQKTEKTTKAPEESGCGSLLGGAGIALTAILAIGIGFTRKNKD